MFGVIWWCAYVTIIMGVTPMEPEDELRMPEHKTFLHFIRLML